VRADRHGPASSRTARVSGFPQHEDCHLRSVRIAAAVRSSSASSSYLRETPPAMTHNQQAIEQPERGCRHHEQVHRGNGYEGTSSILAREELSSAAMSDTPEVVNASAPAAADPPRLKPLGATKHRRPSRTRNPLRRHSIKTGYGHGKKAWLERRPRVRWSLPLPSCRTICRSNASYFPPGSRTLSEQPI
jgi:hypothetical protein